MQKESSTSASYGSHFANRCALRWNALLAENSILHQEHMELLAKFTPPFSRQQIAELEASAKSFCSACNCLSPNGPMKQTASFCDRQAHALPQGKKAHAARS